MECIGSDCVLLLSNGRLQINQHISQYTVQVYRPKPLAMGYQFRVGQYILSKFISQRVMTSGVFSTRRQSCTSRYRIDSSAFFRPVISEVTSRKPSSNRLAEIRCQMDWLASL